MRELVAIVGDKLAADVCLMAYLDDPTIALRHGSAAACGQPSETHNSEPIRTEQEHWPADFCNAVVTFGQFSASPSTSLRPGPQESWTFRVGIFTHAVIHLASGEERSGKLWALDIYTMVRRILAQERERRPCAEEAVYVGFQQHEGDVIPHSWNAQLGAWQIVTRFRWDVVSRGIQPPLEAGCCPE